MSSKGLYTPEQQALLDMQEIDNEGRSFIRAYKSHEAHQKLAKVEEALKTLGLHEAKYAEIVQEFDSKLRKLEAELQDVKTKQDSDIKLRDNSIDARTVAALTRSIEASTRRIDKIEFDTLGLMEERQTQEASRLQLENKMNELIKVRKDLSTALDALKSQVDAKVQSLKLKRDEAASKVSANLLEKYAAIAVEKSGVAVESFTGVAGSVCSVQLSVNDRTRIEDSPGETLICPSCKRIMVVSKHAL